MQNQRVIDASNAILGRLSSIVAKRLLEGERIIIVNAEKAVISGSKYEIINEYKNKFKKRTLTSPWKGPFHYRRPDKLVKRTIRGMLPYKKAKGRMAYRRLVVHIGVPDNINKENIIKLKEADANRLKNKYLSVKELAKELGWSYKEEI
ncbi:MAG: 50S ribosomal protein L13 [Candidatus Odinarchaeia archaeon]